MMTAITILDLKIIKNSFFIFIFQSVIIHMCIFPLHCYRQHQLLKSPAALRGRK